MDGMKPLTVIAAVLLAGLVAAATGWVVGGLAWTAFLSLKGTR